MTNKKLVPYEEHTEKYSLKVEPKIASGVACSDFVPVKKKVEEKYRTKSGKLKTRKVERMVKDGSKRCEGEMYIVVPKEEGYVKGRAGEPDAKKSGQVRAVCNKCGWRGWVRELA